MKRIRPEYVALFFVALIAVFLGWAVAQSRAADERPEWVLLRGELSGQSPDKVAPEALTAAMLMVMLNHPDQVIPVFQTSVVIACNSKVRPKRAVVFLLYGACQLLPDHCETFVNIARDVCPHSGAAEKVVAPKKEIEEDLSTPMNFAGITPPSGSWVPVTPVTEIRRK